MMGLERSRLLFGLQRIALRLPAFYARKGYPFGDALAAPLFAAD
jgi:hypothetical protein